jgi:hypothetical protein
MKRYLKFVVVLASFILFSQTRAYSQDLMILRDGNELKVKILQVGTEDISYKRFDNMQGPTYSVKNWEIFKIKFENGSEESFIQYTKPGDNTSSMVDLFPKKKKPTNFKAKGFLNITTLNFGMDNYKYVHISYYGYVESEQTRTMTRIGVTTINGYQFGKSFSSGLGIGIGSAIDRGMTAPVFLDFRIYTSNKRLKPSFYADFGGMYVDWARASNQVNAGDMATGFLPFGSFGGGIKYFLNEKIAWVSDLSIYVRGPFGEEVEGSLGKGFLISTGISF